MSYLAFTGLGTDHEVSVSVNIKIAAGFVRIDSDICGDEGRVVADGPAFNKPFIGWDRMRPACEEWLSEFKKFLIEKNDVIAEEIRALT